MYPKYEYEYKDGVAKCTIILEGNQKFEGFAFCAEEDKDMESRITGITIALYRAQLAAMIDERDNILLPGLRALKDLYYSINRSKQYNPKSYEARMLWRKMRCYEEDLQYVRTGIKNLKASLTKYLDDKDTFHNEIRKLRGQNKLND